MNRVRGEGGRFNAGSVRNRSRLVTKLFCFITLYLFFHNSRVVEELKQWKSQAKVILGV